MKIVCASTSAVKLNACKKAFANWADADIQTVKAASGVPEQPLGLQTLTGAFNRIVAAKKAIPDADVYISIENGVFEENGTYVDRAIVVMCTRDGIAHVSQSEGVKFPTESVLEARERGFDVWTVGKVMAEQGIVKQHDDPHLCLSGKSRTTYIDDAMAKAISALKLRP